MANDSTSSFSLPNGQTVEAYVVKRPDGTVVVRTREELERAPSAPATGAPPQSPAK